MTKITLTLNIVKQSDSKSTKKTDKLTKTIDTGKLEGKTIRDEFDEAIQSFKEEMSQRFGKSFKINQTGLDEYEEVSS